MVDCRWLGHGGAGRVTELLLRGLVTIRPSGRWVLWGEPPPALCWPEARVVPETCPPTAAHGQAAWRRLPPGDVTVFLHQQRPARRVRSVTFVYDTISLRFGHPVVRLAKREFLRRVLRSPAQVVTASTHARECIIDELGVDPARVTRVVIPFDPDLSTRLRGLRAVAPAEPRALYVGNHLRHKNLDRLLDAFPRTDFARRGGRLVLAGGGPDECRRTRSHLTPAASACVDVLGPLGQEQLEQEMARASFLIQPSLDEGFGLPAWEALSGGIPVCVSDGGSLPEIVGRWAEPFPARCTAAMASAIDDAAARSACSSDEDADRTVADLRDRAPSLEAFAGTVIEVADRAAATV